ncbi:YeeE/YedE family protein [Parapedobacter tibetensis]|uniref:YeeE/YedE family protein n=1 Tax=Parapedobacter tibetensis TaxID=2972951 RepID=UPI00214D4450|nr:YeeE/YedE family protein [Parapedobacter tibetensis]
MIEFFKQPWPWYIAGPLIGLTVPALLLLGNKHFGISANLRHVCAACFPANISFFQYNYKKELWNLFFIIGIFLGAVISTMLLTDPNPIRVSPPLVDELAGYGITDYSNMVPKQLYNWEYLLTPSGLIMMIGGGFLVGFGSRYAGGCTSGHAIMGLSTLQWPSLVATICFMVGGFIMANLILPLILQ